MRTVAELELEAYHGALARLGGLARFGVRPGLDAIARVMGGLGHPERAFPSLHIAGTNGKGSTAAFAAAMLQSQGARTGLYTSPHLLRFTERIRVDGEEVARPEIARLIDRVMAAPGGEELTFFEVATAAAFLHFASARVDVAVVECGLGGRWDATSICAPFATVVTRVALDHTEVLGDTLEKIAVEKAGIARAGVPLIVGALDVGSRAVVERVAGDSGAPVFALGRELFVSPGLPSSDGRQRIDYRGPGGALVGAELGLAGAHQIENAALAIAAASFAPAPFAPLESARRTGLAAAHWPARLERLAPDLLLDAAHNPDGAEALARSLGGGPRVVLLVGMLADKDVGGVLSRLAPIAARVICTRPDSPRALSGVALAERFASVAPDLVVEAIDDPATALRAARDAAHAMGTSVVACGSIFLVGALRGMVLGEAGDSLRVSDPAATAEAGPDRAPDR